MTEASQVNYPGRWERFWTIIGNAKTILKLQDESGIYNLPWISPMRSSGGKTAKFQFLPFLSVLQRTIVYAEGADRHYIMS